MAARTRKNSCSEHQMLTETTPPFTSLYDSSLSWKPWTIQNWAGTHGVRPVHTKPLFLVGLSDLPESVVGDPGGQGVPEENEPHHAGDDVAHEAAVGLAGLEHLVHSAHAAGKDSLGSIEVPAQPPKQAVMLLGLHFNVVGQTFEMRYLAGQMVGQAPIFHFESLFLHCSES